MSRDLTTQLDNLVATSFYGGHSRGMRVQVTVFPYRDRFAEVTYMPSYIDVSLDEFKGWLAEAAKSVARLEEEIEHGRASTGEEGSTG